MTPISPGEIVLTIIGLSNVIKNEVPKWTQERQRQFEKFPDQIEELARQTVTGKIKLKPLKREHDYRKLLERLSRPLPEAEIQQLTELGTEHAGDLMVAVTNAWDRLKEIFPVSEYQTFAGGENILPTGDKTWLFFVQLAALNDVLGAFNLIGGGAMLRSQADEIRSFYPTISAAMDEAIYAAIAEETAEKPGFRMSPRVQAGLEGWMNRRSVDFDPDPQSQIIPASMQDGKMEQNSKNSVSALWLRPTDRPRNAQDAGKGR